MLLPFALSTTLLFISFGIGASYESAQRKMAIGYDGEVGLAVTSRWADWITKSELPETEGIQHIAGLLTAAGLYAEDGYYENIDILSGDLADIDAINAP